MSDDSPGADCAPTMTGEKKEAVREYLGKVGPDLRKKHGKQDTYSPEQVRRSVEDQGLGLDYVCFAYCMYCSPYDFDLVHSAAGEVCDYGVMRSLVGDTFFGGSSTFDALGVADLLLAGTTATNMLGTIGGMGAVADGIGDAASGAADAASGLWDLLGGIGSVFD